MDHKQLRRSKKLIRKLCCNYDHGNCLALDDGEPCVCVQGISYSLLCNWFRNAVLPADHELLADVMLERAVRDADDASIFIVVDLLCHISYLIKGYATV